MIFGFPRTPFERMGPPKPTSSAVEEERGPTRAFWPDRLFFLAREAGKFHPPIGGMAVFLWDSVEKWPKSLILDNHRPTGCPQKSTGWAFFPTGSICSVSLQLGPHLSLSLSFQRKKEREIGVKRVEVQSTGRAQKSTGQTPAQNLIHGLRIAKRPNPWIPVGLKPLVGAALR